MEKRLKDTLVPPEEIVRQGEYIQKCASVLSARFRGRAPKAFVHTYGCQGNVADSERIIGMLSAMGCELVDSPDGADIVLFNTCAIRGHAEDRVFGNVGALKVYKTRNPGMIIALCGCMMQQEHRTQKIKNSFPYVDLVFGTHALYKFPELLSKTLCTGKRVFDTDADEAGAIAEGLPVFRAEGENAWLPIMYGCDNFCSYCVVPYVRGRERSRSPEAVIAEARDILSQGYKKITLLGQNVNSYGHGCSFDCDFSSLITKLDALEGNFTFDFMTSHPKDCNERLLDTLKESEHFCGHLHLPVQSGSNRILKAMNRGYTREHYSALINSARERMPDVSITTDIIVGFPGEDREDFDMTLSLIKQVRYDSMFTFIFSPREGTKAAKMEDPVTLEEKTKRFLELLSVQEGITGRKSEPA